MSAVSAPNDRHGGIRVPTAAHRHALEKTDVKVHLVPFHGLRTPPTAALRRNGAMAQWRNGGHLCVCGCVRTVPSILTKGRATCVCHSSGLSRTRLTSVSRSLVDLPSKASGKWSAGASRAAEVIVWWLCVAECVSLCVWWWWRQAYKSPRDAPSSPSAFLGRPARPKRTRAPQRCCPPTPQRSMPPGADLQTSAVSRWSLSMRFKVTCLSRSFFWPDAHVQRLAHTNAQKTMLLRSTLYAARSTLRAARWLALQRACTQVIGSWVDTALGFR